MSYWLGTEAPETPPEVEDQVDVTFQLPPVVTAYLFAPSVTVVVIDAPVVQP